MTQARTSPLTRARRRVLRAALDLAREAHVERHNETFYATLARAVEALVYHVDGDARTLRLIWMEARSDEEDQYVG